MLERLGYILNQKSQIWQKPNYAGIAYSDGDQVEESIAEVIADASDLSVLSEELARSCIDWPSTYHLSASRANLLRPISKILKGEILEVGAGCGAITRFLGECGANVLALEGSPRRAAIARSRTRDQRNVTVLSDNFDQFISEMKFDVVTMIGVFEYAEIFMSGENRALKMLKKAHSLLKPNGKLIIAIENQLGLKYFAGAPEDHLSDPMYGIEDHYKTGEAKTYGKKELTLLLKEAGLVHSQFFAPFPDYKLPVSIVSDAGFAEPLFDASALAWQSIDKDPQLPLNLNFSLARTWPIVARNGLGLDLANSFLIVSGVQNEDLWGKQHLAWHYSTERKIGFCKATEFVKTHDHIEVIYSRLSSKTAEFFSPTEDNSNPLSHRLPTKAEYFKGQTLSWELLQILSRKGWELKEVAQFTKRYLSCVENLAKKMGVGFCTDTISSKVNGKLFDCIPQNIINTHDGNHHFIDQEWIFNGELELGYLIYRALLPSFHHCAPYDKPGSGFDGTRINLLESVVKLLGLEISKAKINEYSEIEAKIQSSISKSSTQLSGILAWLNSELRVQNTPIENLISQQSKIYSLDLRLEETHQELRKTQDALVTTQEQIRLKDSQLLEKEFQLGQADKSRELDESTIANLTTSLSAKEASISEISSTITERDGKISELVQLCNEQTTQTQALKNSLVSKDREIAEIKALIDQLNAEMRAIISSRSWTITKPMRIALSYMRKAKRALLLTPKAVSHGGGIIEASKKAFKIIRLEGLRGAKRRLRTLEIKVQTSPSSAVMEPKENGIQAHLKIPWYVDPRLDSQDCKTRDIKSVAVHLHLSKTDSIKKIEEYISNIKHRFDLFISCDGSINKKHITKIFRRNLPNINKLLICNAHNVEPKIVSMINNFAEYLVSYEIVGHFETKVIGNSTNPNDTTFEEMSRLLGPLGSSGERINNFFDKIQEGAKIIFSANDSYLSETSGLSTHDIKKAAELINIALNDTHLKSAEIEYPPLGCFWSNSTCLKDIFTFPLSGCIETLGQEMRSEILNQILFSLIDKNPGTLITVHESDSISDYKYYEPQLDFRGTIRKKDIKVLSFYLPQFHPIAENDEWHGKGFTEWTKVRAANPLFEGHYQQHIPHSDIGYYLLDNPETLRKQAQMMEKSGVFGQVFYHYWFNGKLILEEPARLLLASPDINMPFCFCWANENWTRRWDGNEKEVLLAQKYSEEDARQFIKYLIPFFKDSRYITVEDRPVIFVYRPSSIPDPKVYIQTWQDECSQAGLPKPFVVAVLTRGAINPNDFDMDAGVERVLHDWTDGCVPDIKDRVRPYGSINGSILSYPEVAEFYSKQNQKKNFPYFRSIVPIWDNTARYGKDAYVLHGSTPEMFQSWFEHLVEYTQNNLADNKRFILVNAWNEWAEGAHLEPDSRYGYSYLNSIGRALSQISYTTQEVSLSAVSSPLKIHLKLTSNLRRILQTDVRLKGILLQPLSKSSALKKFHFTVSADDIDFCNIKFGLESDSDIIVELRNPALFSSDILERLIYYANSTKSTVIPNYYHPRNLAKTSANGSIDLDHAVKSPILVYPNNNQDYKFKCFKMLENSLIFPVNPETIRDSDKPVVTTIIRFHQSGDLNLLKNSLSCLAAMQDCICNPLIAAQDISEEVNGKLNQILNDIPWHEASKPEVIHYNSNDKIKDLRSEMLNQSLKSVKTRYVAFLDYDDLLMPHAYSWLINRLKKTEKAVSFGRVYSTSFVIEKGIMIDRAKSFQYGYSYPDFFNNNHAPLHSFLLDLSKLNLEKIFHYQNQKYMEDYLLTLQLFNEQNCDWESLSLNEYIGDYIHSIDRAHTLAFSNEEERAQLHSSSEYLICLERINNLRQKLLDTKSQAAG